jgi:hypothetical protein
MTAAATHDSLSFAWLGAHAAFETDSPERNCLERPCAYDNVDGA